VFLARRDRDVRDACPNRTPRADRARQRAKSDTLDAERIVRETLAHALLPTAFKRAPGEAGPDEQTALLTHLAQDAPVDPDHPTAPPQRGGAAARPARAAPRQHRPCARGWPRSPTAAAGTPPPRCGLRLLVDYRQQIARLDADEQAACSELATLVRAGHTPVRREAALSPGRGKRHPAAGRRVGLAAKRWL
jgi:hypothetical protein